MPYIGIIATVTFAAGITMPEGFIGIEVLRQPHLIDFKLLINNTSQL
jgi:hypothetical protein